MEYSRFIAGKSVVHFGLSLEGTPANYVVAYENNSIAPLDPYFGFTQNWVGTFEITSESQAVPEPSTIALLLTGGVGLIGYGWRRKKQPAA